ncbi:claspin isoform X2 [Aplysia californica]|uniref:Claspin isoform X2 n=1 Tax=Aplysia californica TaxID=6500 RepID=A0ABM0JH67_APLCA|nr:claspin isoform X2 [Aplysia californica]
MSEGETTSLALPDQMLPVEQSKQEETLLPQGKTVESDAEKSDSGMDEESFLQSQGSADSDEEVISRKKSARKSKMIIDDEDDEPEVGKELDDEEETTAPSGHSQDGLPSQDSESKDTSEAEDNNTEETSDSMGLHFNLQNNDIFDAESSDDDDGFPGPAEKAKSGSSQQEEEEEDADNGASDEEEPENSGDEGFDESQVDPELLKKLKKMKGAGKSEKQREKHSRKAKPTAEKMLEIFSESQRLLRDSRVNLPYYEPQAKSLDDFLARASKKKQEYAALRRPKDFLKAQIIHEKLSITPPKLEQLPKKQKKSSRGPELKESTETCTSSNETQVLSCDDSGVNSQELLQPSTLELELDTQALPSQAPANETSCDEDDQLPDLVPSHRSDISQLLSDNTKNSLFSENDKRDCSEDISGPKDSLSLQNEPCDSMLKVGSDVSSSAQCEPKDRDLLFSVSSLSKDPSRDLFRSQSSVGEMSGQHQLAGSADDFCETTVTRGKHCTEEPLEDQDHGQTMVKESLDQQNYGQTEASSPSQTAEALADNTSQPRKRLFDKFQGLALPASPCLKGTPDEVICLDEPSPQATPKNTGLQKLLDRLAQHSKKRTPRPAKDVNISIVEKEGEAGEKKELKLKSFTYHVQEEESVLDESGTGSKLSLLKRQLGQGMRKKRAEALHKRQQLYALENEEGFEKAKDDNEFDEEEEEAEMTDGSDTDGESEEDDLELQFGHMNEDSDDGKDYNPLLDTEAKDDEDEAEYASNFDEDSNDVHLRLDMSDEEAEDEPEEEDDKSGSEEENRDSDVDDFGLMSQKKKKTKHALIASDDEDETEDKSCEDETTTSDLNKVKDVPLFPDLWSDELSPMTKHLQDTQTQERRKYRSDSRSPDLYSMADESESPSGQNFDHLNDSSQSIGSYNPHSQFLDADGYIKVAQTQKPRSRIAQLAQNSGGDGSAFGSSFPMTAGALFKGSQAGADEISATAIFQGSGSQVDGGEITASALFRGSASQEQPDANMQELMGLCSGTFGQDSLSEDAFPVSQNRRDHTPGFNTSEKKVDKDTDDPFDILSDLEEEEDTTQQKWKKRVLSDTEDEAGDEEEDEAASDTEDVVSEAKFTGFKNKKKGIRREFVEEEAELSGSEYDSDENDDLAEEDDILEEEAGDRDMAGVSEEALRNQVGRVHMKRLQDDDDREVMRFKEMYLQDGDLYSEGGGRMRNFRWKDMDEASQQDMFGDESDHEQPEEENDEAQWRKDRMEREKFLEESQSNDGGNNNFLKMGKILLTKEPSLPLAEQEPTCKSAALPSQPKPKLAKKGSFLARSKEALVKIAQVAKGAFGGKSSGKAKAFVFHAVDNSENQNENEANLPPQPFQPPKRKARDVPKGHIQAAKKQKMASESPSKPEIKRQNSIFNLLEKK